MDDKHWLLEGIRFEVGSDKPIRQGNFQTLLLFRIDAGDEVLREHLFTCGHNATNVSKEIQNQIIHICGNIHEKILHKIRAAKFYSLIADEATDAANDEQLSTSIRFVDGYSPQEKFLGFNECTSGVTSEAIACDILQ